MKEKADFQLTVKERSYLTCCDDRDFALESSGLTDDEAKALDELYTTIDIYELGFLKGEEISLTVFTKKDDSRLFAFKWSYSLETSDYGEGYREEDLEKYSPVFVVAEKQIVKNVYVNSDGSNITL